MNELGNSHCIPCRGDLPALDEAQIAELLGQLEGWHVEYRDGVAQLEKRYRAGNFRQAMDFAVRVGELAEAEDHHPALRVEWGRLTVTWWTHAIGGLHRNDFIMAARTDTLLADSTAA